MANCLAALCPEAEFDPVLADRVLVRGSQEATATELIGYDVVLTQRFDSPALGPLQTIQLRERAARLMLFPKIGFTGFHPDIVVVPGVRAGRLRNYHSAIVAGAWAAGLPASRVPRLFNAYVFRRLGYFDEYQKARLFLRKLCQRCELRGEVLVSAWEREGLFMHTPNHPTIQALNEVARLLCAKLGLPAISNAELPPDSLAPVCKLPVYPELARHLGIEARPEIVVEDASLSPEEAIAEAYATYAATPPDLAAFPVMAAAADLIRAEVAFTALSA